MVEIRKSWLIDLAFKRDGIWGCRVLRMMNQEGSEL